MNKRDVNIILRHSFYIQSDIVFAIDKKLKVVLLNKKAKDFFNIANIDDVIDKDVSYLVKYNNLQNLVIKFIKDKKLDFKEEVIHLDNDKVFLLSMVLVKNKQNSVIGQIVYLKNLEDIKKLQENTLSLFSQLSNEISQPITSVKGYIETLLDGLYKNSDLTLDFLNIINDELNRLIQLLINISSFSQESKEVQLVKCNLYEIILEAINVVKKLADNKNVLIKNKIFKQDYKILCDNRLKQVFVNILDNAIKYSRKDLAEIVIDIDLKGNYYVVIIKDNGYGILDEEKDLIFNRFYRGKAARDLKVGGSGLGLWVSYEIMKYHKGKIEVESDENYTIFKVFIRREL